MENKGWIKLHRQLLDKEEIWIDHKSLVVFMWLLVKVNKDGEKIVGRFWASKELGMNPSTFYKVLQRLDVKYKIVTLTSNNRFTKVRLLNWAKYQTNSSSVTQGSNNRVTTGEHSYRIKNKEYIDKGEKILIGEDARKKINEMKNKNPFLK